MSNSAIIYDNRYDEMSASDGSVRPHWRPLADTLTRASADQHVRFRSAAEALIRDNGVTYNVYDDVGGQHRPWQLDIVPYVIAPGDWEQIEVGIRQRAELTNTILRDIYGSQKLIAEGHLSPHIVAGNPQFLRSLMGASPPHGVYVHLYSADITRTPTGSWVVLNTRADAPSGIGYALENRIVVGQIFPDLFAEMQIQRLASFFNSYRECVLSLAHSRKGRLVLLTPGPHNEAYFEHAYLAHYLGLTLVEGSDLIVRDGQAFLKTLMGPERVSVIFRRIDSDFCDPLELRGESALGVPGLIDALRSGSVVIANALGGGVMESPAIDLALPALARVVLGEDLKIPGVPGVWCGAETGRKEAVERMDQFVLRDAFDARTLFSKGSSARLGRELSIEDKQKMRNLLDRRGATVVAQQLLPFGKAPVFENGIFDKRPVSIRVFAAWTPEGYVVMPGGLARIAMSGNTSGLSMQSGAVSKDIWIPAMSPVDKFSLLKRSGSRMEIRREGDAPPSRAMDNLFWLGRYTERAENMVRVLRAVITRLGEKSQSLDELTLRFVSTFIQSQSELSNGIDGEERTILSQELHALLYDESAAGGLQRLLSRVRQTAWAARDRLSLDTWRTIHVFTQRQLRSSEVHALDSAESLLYLDALVRRAASLSGLSAENMTRGPDWVFVGLGHRIERAAHLAWLVRQTTASGFSSEADGVRLALEVADSFMTYRSRYMNTFQRLPLADLLLLDETNPRSAIFQLNVIDAHIRGLPRITQEQRSDNALKVAQSLHEKMQEIAASILPSMSEDALYDRISALTDYVDIGMSQITNAITRAYFQHVPYRRTGGASHGLI